MKHLSALILTALLAVSAGAQTKIILSYEHGDATSFGYSPHHKGGVVQVSHRFKERWAAIGSFELNDAEKAHIGNGSHQAGSLGVRFYPKSIFFLTGGAAVSRDSNSEYVKTVIRGFVGGGIEAGGLRATVTAFAPSTGFLADPNAVRGLTGLLEFERSLFGPVGLYTAFQASLAGFKNGPQDFQAAAWKGRAGVSLTF